MLQSTNQRRLLPPGNPGTTCPLRLFQTCLPSPPSLPSFTCFGKKKENLVFLFFFPLSLAFFSVLPPSPPSDIVGLWDPRRTKSRKSQGSWVFPFPESRRELSLVSRWSWGPERRLRLCPGCCYRAVPAPRARRPRSGLAISRGSRRGGVWAGSAACPLLSPG